MEKHKNNLNIGVSLFFGVVGASIVMFLVIFAAYFMLDLSFVSNASCGSTGEAAYCFFDDKWDSDTYLSIITEFYSTVITVLIFLVGVMAAFAYVVIRGSAMQQAEEEIEREVDRYFETGKAQERILRGMGEAWKGEVGSIQERLELIEDALMYNEILPETIGVDDESDEEEDDEKKAE